MAESADEQVRARRSTAGDVQRIKEQIAGTRDRMAATIDAIHYRVDPRAMRSIATSPEGSGAVADADRTARMARIALRTFRFAASVLAMVRARSNGRRRPSS